MTEVSWTWFILLECLSVDASLPMDQHEETQHEEHGILQDGNGMKGLDVELKLNKSF